MFKHLLVPTDGSPLITSADLVLDAGVAREGGGLGLAELPGGGAEGGKP